MAPLSEALAVRKVSDGRDAGTSESVWTGVIDSEWTIGVVANGGYLVGLVVEACLGHQGVFAEHAMDPITISVHFLRAAQAFEKDRITNETRPATFEVQVKTVKTGAATTNLHAELVQNGKACVSTHLIFGTLLDDAEPKQLLPPSPYAHRIPIRTHPARSDKVNLPPLGVFWNFKDRWSATECPTLLNLNKPENRAYQLDNSSSLTREPPGIEYAVWFSLTDKEEVWRPSMLPFAMDIMTPLPELLPPELAPHAGKLWYPTLTMSIEFKAPMRHIRDMKNVIGMYSCGRFIQDPLGRYSSYVEVWTSPPEGSDPNDPSWREKQRCIAVNNQVALSLPFEFQNKDTKSKI